MVEKISKISKVLEDTIESIDKTKAEWYNEGGLRKRSRGFLNLTNITHLIRCILVLLLVSSTE
jgi:hypothetical protein